MGEWCREQWKQVRGSFKYEAAKSVLMWFYVKMGASVVATVTSLIAFLRGHREASLLIGIPAIFWVLQMFFAWVVPKRLNLQFVPHGDNSPLLCLEVKNKGDDAELTANIRVINRSYGGAVDTCPFIGQWTSPSFRKKWNDDRPDPTLSEVTIPSGNHRILEIAKQDLDNGVGNDISTAYLIGSNEFIKWDFEQKPGSSLPSMRLQIEFQAEGVPKSLCKLYDVGPVHAYGPLGMKEVTT